MAATRILRHLPLSAASRAARLALAEKAVPFTPEPEPVWERRADFLALNPAGEVPVLIDVDGTVVAGGRVLLEYLDEAYPAPPLLPETVAARAECRRLVDWFAGKFHGEVTRPLVHEKIFKRFLRLGHPDSEAIRAARERVDDHLAYLDGLVDRRRWLSGDALGQADLVAAAELSVVDYVGDVPWARHDPTRDWYAKIKSRPSFRPLLADFVPGAMPPPHYADLDF